MLIIKPIIHETIWGGNKLTPYSGTDNQSIGHLYSLISNGEFESEIVNGPYKGKQFRQYFEENKEKLGLGYYKEMPFLLALVDASDDLSLQVHPNDKMAKILENADFGKNESWYFLQAPKSGKIFCGCRAAHSQELKEKIAQEAYTDIIDYLPIRTGDYVYIQAGTMHAMSAGSLVYEIEENCNATYRVYDFDRIDKNGKKRPLQTEKALQSIDVRLKSKVEPYTELKTERLYSTQIFHKQTQYTNTSNTLECLTFLSGQNVIEGQPIHRGITIVLEPGEQIKLKTCDFVMARPLQKPNQGKTELSASMMCANFSCLKQEVENLENANIDIFHIDIMDGSFVDNFGMGYQDMAYIKHHTTKPVEAHLMVRQPYNYLDILFNLGIDIIYIHPEIDPDPATTIEKIHTHGAIAGIAINPGTSIASIIELLNTVDRVMVLGVNPGHAGRLYQTYVDNKIIRLLELKDQYKFDIYLDGAVTYERICRWAPKGVKGFVLGTSTLFKRNVRFNTITDKIREAISKLKGAE